MPWPRAEPFDVLSGFSIWTAPEWTQKLIHGEDRTQALDELEQALGETHIAGTVTNAAFLRALCKHEGFAAGEVDTGLIGRETDALTAAPDETPLHRVAAGMAVLGLRDLPEDAGFALWQPMRRGVTLSRAGEDLTLGVTVTGPRSQVWDVDDTEIMLEHRGGCWQAGGTPVPDAFVSEGSVTVFDAFGITYGWLDPLQRDTGAAGDGNLIEAPMPGVVRAMNAAVGQTVNKGDRLALLEAMKMEHALLAARDGVVAEVLVQAGDQVEAGAALIRLEPEAGDA